MIPLIVAPFLAKLAESGLNLIFNAVNAKGKDIVEKTLGIDLEKTVQTEEGLFKLKQLELDHEEFLISAAQKQAEVNLNVYKLEVENTSSAREMNTRIQESSASSKLAREAPYYLDFIVVGATLILASLLIFVGVPLINEKLVYMAFGSLVTLCGTIINFHRGSSSSSVRKEEQINSMMGVVK